MEEFAIRDAHAADLAKVKPGMTGLWQILGRCDLKEHRRMACERYYARRWSFGLDLRILLATPVAVLRARGAR